jgi:DNA-binding transcriptional MerR regulator
LKVSIHLRQTAADPGDDTRPDSPKGVNTCTASVQNEWMVAFEPCSDPDTAAAPQEVYGLEELLEVAGQQLGEEVNSRTVRLYPTQGLIDRPGKEGRHAVYGRRHLLQLLLIRNLARRGLSLAAIAPLVVLPNDQLEEQLVQVDQPVPPTASNPALEYLKRLKADDTSDLAMEREPFVLDQHSLADDSSSSFASYFLPSLGSPYAKARISRAYSSEIDDSPPMRGGSRQASARWPSGHRRKAWLKRLFERLREQLDDTD